MNKARLEAFSDGVFAIIITIMVLELKPPHHEDLASLRPLFPIAMSYVLTFLTVAIYWYSHHQLFQTVSRVDTRVLWANMHFLFWLSFMPFFTNWLGESGFGSWPVAIYGILLLIQGTAYTLLFFALLRCHGPDTPLARMVAKGLATIVITAIGIGVAFVSPVIACLLYASTGMFFVVSEPEIEPTVSSDDEKR